MGGARGGEGVTLWALGGDWRGSNGQEWFLGLRAVGQSLGGKSGAVGLRV